jgi:hypothetical protein
LRPVQTNSLRPYLENTQHKNRADRVFQVVERLPSKCEVLSSNPSTTKNINEKKKKKTADPVSTNEPGMVVCACHLSYAGG